MCQRRLVFLAGLPRSGSTLLANILAQHTQLHATATSPLYPLFEKLRATWSSEVTALAQMDPDFEQVYARLVRSTRAFMQAWSADTPKPVTVDKHRGWLFCLETLRSLYPDLKMILCLRDLRDVYGSIERQHRRTLMLNYPDDTEHNLVEPRAAQFFSAQGVVGHPLRALRNLGDIPDPFSHLHVVRYEWFMENPPESLERLMRWLEVPVEELDLRHVPQTTHEDDSYYRFKFRHAIKPTVRQAALDRSDLSTRILATIVDQHRWFYRAFYDRNGVNLDALRGVEHEPAYQQAERSTANV
jgi:sulfotransferase